MAITFQPQAELSAGTLAASNVAVMPSLFQPAYPSGSVYDAWVASLPLSSLLTDADGDGSTADDRCSTDGEAGIRLLTATLSAALIPQDLGCTLLPAPTNVINCTAASVISGSILANDILLSQCTDQDGLVDAAEIEAAYENSKIISGQVYAVASQIDTIRDGITTIQVTLEANHTEVMETMAANHTEVMDTMAANQAQSLKIEIERALRDTNDGKRLSYFYLPEAYGGLLELVRETVWDAINANQAAGLSTGGAQSWFDRAEASFQRSDFKNAFDQYAKAYQETIK